MSRLVEHIASLEFIYFTPFDLPVPVNERADIDLYESDLSNFACASYRLDTDQAKAVGDPARLLGALREVYRERVREVFRHTRQSLIVELKPIFVSSVTVRTGADTPLATAAGVKITPVIVIHGVGTGTLSLWLDLGPVAVTNEVLLASRDDLAVRVHIDQPYYGLRYLQGTLDMREISDLLILMAVKAGQQGTTSSNDIDRAREKAGSTRAALTAILAALPDRRHIYSGLETYFAATARTDLNSADMHAMVTSDAALIRGLITGDKNWQRKAKAIVEKAVPGADVSTRESIAWFMQLNGAAKLYSTELETPYEQSASLMAFELDVLLTQRLVLLKSAYYLSTVSRTDGYRELLRVRESQLRVVNEFYSSTLAFKDTTASRLDSLASTFRLDSLQAEADRLLQGLSESLQATQESRILQRQTLLAVLFSAFGGASIGFDVAMASHKPDTALTFVYWVTVLSFVGSVIAAWVLSAHLLRSDRG